MIEATPGAYEVGRRLGLANAVNAELTHATRTVAELEALAAEPSGLLRAPFTLESSQACIAAYLDGLDLVTRRFWTTSFLSSAFWTRGDAAILAANRTLSRRLGAGGGDSRRLFILGRSAVDEAERWKNDYIYHSRRRDTERIAEMEDALANLEAAVRTLAEDGCVARMVFQHRAEPLRLPAGVAFDPHDGEIALYDGVRVDVFTGGSRNIVLGATVYTGAMEGFDAIRAWFESYFDALWERGESAEAYLALLLETRDAARNRIDYASNWLAQFEFALDVADREVKTVEMKRVQEVLRRQKRWGSIGRYLDVGTCTARYPRTLAEAVVADGEIVGIDEDAEAIAFAGALTRREHTGPQRIELLQMDFCGRESVDLGRFDLITCMMSTLSHFSRSRDAGGEDPLQLGLRRFAALLNDDGLLVFSVWSEYARTSGRMLGIYDPSDVQKLREWTPSLEDLRRRLPAAGLEIVEESQPDERLDLLFCRRLAAPKLAAS